MFALNIIQMYSIFKITILAVAISICIKLSYNWYSDTTPIINYAEIVRSFPPYAHIHPGHLTKNRDGDDLKTISPNVKSSIFNDPLSMTDSSIALSPIDDLIPNLGTSDSNIAIVNPKFTVTDLSHEVINLSLTITDLSATFTHASPIITTFDDTVATNVNQLQLQISQLESQIHQLKSQILEIKV